MTSPIQNFDDPRYGATERPVSPISPVRIQDAPEPEDDDNDGYEQWSLTAMDEVLGSTDDILDDLGEWEDYLYGEELIRSVRFTMESERGASVQGQKFFFVVLTDTSEDDDPVRLDDIVPELIPVDVSLKVMEFTRMKLLRATMSEEKEASGTVAYGIKDESVGINLINDIMDAYLVSDDDIATAVLEDMEDMFSGLV